MEADYGTPELRQEFELCTPRKPANRRAAAAPTLACIFDKSEDSAKFKALAPRAAKDYRGTLDILRDEFGHMPISVLSVRGIRGAFMDLRDECGEESARAGRLPYRGTVGREVPGVDRNPFVKAGKLYNSDRSDWIWSVEQIKTLLSVAPDHIALPCMLALHGPETARPAAPGWRQYDGERITLRPAKTERHVSKLAARQGDP